MATSYKLQRRTAASGRNPKSAKRGFIVKNVVLHFYKLKIKLEQLQRECTKEVKVEKIGQEFVVRVSCCNKGGDKLVSVLSAFDELGLDVVRASVSCGGHLFSMEAIAVAQGQQTSGVRDITRAVIKAIDDKQGGEVETVET
ncbi:hypothetical protein GQ457_14G009060 [Hibiscus cannabinus]